MKKTFVIVLSVLLVLGSVAFAQGTKESAAPVKNQVLKVGATPEPHAELLNLVKDDLAAQGITLDVIEFTDYVTPNEALESGEIDANYFQHIPYLESFNKEKGYHLVNAGGIHVEPFAVYSKKYTKLADLPTVLPSPSPTIRPTKAAHCASAERRAPEAGRWSWSDRHSAGHRENPKNFKFKEIEPPLFPVSFRC
jgi:D-methionine transport system substrate-binding protein